MIRRMGGFISMLAGNFSLDATDGNIFAGGFDWRACAAGRSGGVLRWREQMGCAQDSSGVWRSGEREFARGDLEGGGGESAAGSGAGRSGVGWCNRCDGCAI